MAIVVQGLATVPGAARIWVGAFAETAAPLLSFRRKNGGALAPTVVRALGPALTGNLTTPGAPQVFSGVYEFGMDGVQTAMIEILVNGQPVQDFEIRSLPAVLPRDAWFNVLIASCYHAHEANKPAFRNALDRIPKNKQPDLGLFLGDQVYLDLPTIKVFPSSPSGLASVFLEDYTENWNDPARPAGLASLFAKAPRACLPDDHEYWNNYPHWAPAIAKSYAASGKGHWRAAADALYLAFQSSAAALDVPIEFDVEPLSFFLADSRSARLDSRAQCMSPATRARLRAWVTRIKAAGLYGIFATGQSVIEDAISWKDRADVFNLGGKLGDYALSDYGDFQEIAADILDAARPGRPIFCLTGDVHFGRLVFGTRNAAIDPRMALLELISSPTALVRTVGVDDVKHGKNWVKGLFGRADAWPRHGSGSPPPPEFGQKAGAATSGAPSSIRLRECHRQRGDHFALASFQKRGDDADPGVALEVRYFALHESGEIVHRDDWKIDKVELHKPPPSS